MQKTCGSPHAVKMPNLHQPQPSHFNDQGLWELCFNNICRPIVCFTLVLFSRLPMALILIVKITSYWDYSWNPDPKYYNLESPPKQSRIINPDFCLFFSLLHYLEQKLPLIRDHTIRKLRFSIPITLMIQYILFYRDISSPLIGFYSLHHVWAILMLHCPFSSSEFTMFVLSRIKVFWTLASSVTRI